MGIINPRPAIRKAGIRRVEQSLARHAELMARFEAEGLSREEASRKAFIWVKAGKSDDQ